jgi:choline dehydrogenase-like flavoprotein
MTFLSDKQRQTLATICDTLVPELPAENSPADPILTFAPVKLGLVERLEEAYERITSADEKRDLRLLLNAFEVGIFNGITSGKWRAFSQLPLAEREALLERWADSPYFIQRKAFQSLKRLALFMAYTNMPDDQPHPVWEQIQYPGAPGGDATAPREITPLEIRDNTTLETDVLVIGSGAGGGVVAGELSEAGYDVIVAEKGGYYNEADFDGNELTGNENLYEKYGALASDDTSIMILAGSTLGGGTTVNWSASFRTPDHVLREWKNTYGFTGATSDDFQRSLDAVSQRMNINTDESHLNGNNRVFEEGCKNIGYHVDVIPRNVKGCEDCGFCNYGCSFGAKQSTLKTYLKDAHERGTRIMVRANVRRIMHEGGKVKGAVVDVEGADGRVHTLTIRAKRVVVSAGSIHTPALLMRSGLTNPNIGKNLKLHPVTAIYGVFPEPIHTWHGPPMTRISKEFSDLDNGYGVALEVAPTHPGLFALAFPWQNARQHKELIAHMPYMANVIVITRDYYGGSISTDKFGNPVIHYRLHDYDKKHLMTGVLAALRVHQAAGAKRIFSPHNDVLVYDNEDARGVSSFERYLTQVEERGLEPNAFPLFSAHQMASARIAGTPAQGALKPTGESWEIEGLYVADGSAMPTSSGVNPMVTILGLAHYIAQHVKGSLN